MAIEGTQALSATGPWSRRRTLDRLIVSVEGQNSREGTRGGLRGVNGLRDSCATRTPTASAGGPRPASARLGSPVGPLDITIEWAGVRSQQPPLPRSIFQAVAAGHGPSRRWQEVGSTYTFIIIVSVACRRCAGWCRPGGCCHGSRGSRSWQRPAVQRPAGGARPRTSATSACRAPRYLGMAAPQRC
jgi:hypothetical protein